MKIGKISIMVKAQEWLDLNYPKENRDEVEEIYLSEPTLEGKLDLGDFTHRQGLKVLISLSVDETKLTFKVLPEYSKIIKCVEAQKWLDENYPKEGICVRKEWDGKNHQDFGKKRSEITTLFIAYNHKNLEGSLVLNGFSNLKEFIWSSSKITSLDCSNCKQLEEVTCKYNKLTTLSVNPTNLKKLYLENNNFPNQDLIDKHGSCSKCQKPNTSYRWCQPCREKELQRLEGQELVEKFIQQHQEKDEEQEDKKIQWIPYKEFASIEQIGEGGFSKVYKVKCKEIKKYNNNYASEDVIIKSLNNSQNITLKFLQEITNAQLVSSGYSGATVKCLGISQNPITKNYIMVMEYMPEGNLRQYLCKNSGVSFEDKFRSLRSIAYGLRNVHEQNLVHRDFHSGNILNSKLNQSNRIISYISDLGLSFLTNSQKQDGQIFGVFPYVAPEVLQGQIYNKASDIYSFGIVSYELLANTYPYAEMNDADLALKVCLGHRPDVDKVPIPQEVKDFVKRCWDADSEKRPSAEELVETVNSWLDGHGKFKIDTLFFQQYQALELEYKTFSQNTPYQIHPSTITHSQLINTKEIARLFQESQQQALEQEIKKIERKINQPLTKELKTLVSDFIQAGKKMKKDKKDKEAREEIKKLDKKLREKWEENDAKEKIQIIISYCERFIKSERELEQEKSQANIEIPTNTK